MAVRRTSAVPTRDEAFVAAGSALWAAFFLFDAPTGGLLAAPFYGLAALGFRRWPAVATWAALVVHVAAAQLAGVSIENPGGLATELVVVYGLGRYSTRWTALPPIVGFVGYFAVADGFNPATAVFTAILLGATWAFGHLVRRRTDGARAATATAAELAATDPADAAARVVTAERARLAGEALRIVRDAVSAMQRHATADPDATALGAIQAQGRRATTELRRLLGLLRAEPVVEAGTATPARRGPALVDALTATGVALVVLIEAVPWAQAVQVLPVVLAVALAATLAVRRSDPALACLLAVAVGAVALALDVGSVYGLADVAVYALLAWSVATRGGWRGYLALGTLAAVSVLGVHLHTEAGNEPITLAVFGLAAITGSLWGARDREERASVCAAAALRDAHDAVAARAVRAERLRLARELHDVASHAVGVMVLQAGAADALLARDPERAADAVAEVRAAAVAALRELDALFGLLDAGAVGPAGLAAAEAVTDLDTALHALAERMHAGGVEVSLTLPARTPPDPVLAAVVYRIVQEALTNALRHAPGAAVAVTVVDGPQDWTVEILDDGTDAPAGSGAQGGFGLIGLAERVRETGGELATGPRPTGGFAVTARLPASRRVEPRS